MNENKFKELLRSIVKNQFEIPTSITPRECLPLFYKHIGSKDAELRDDLIFSVMANWIYKGFYTQEQIYKIADTLVQDDFILNGVGQENDDSVFIRSATSLQLWALIVTHKKKNFLPFNTIAAIYEKSLQLLKDEVDYRSYVEGAGWVNSISHTANILYELVQLPEIKKPIIIEIIKAICEKVKQPDLIFQGDETEFLAAPLAEVMNLEILLEEEIIEILSTLKIQPHFHGQKPEDFFKLINVRRFLRATYFYLLDHPDKRRQRDIILIALQELKSE